MPLTDYDKIWCDKILTDLGKWKITIPFRNPVDPVRDGAENYYDIIKNPMDFSTMRKKLTSNQYLEVKDFIDDLYLICDNAVLFNNKDSLIGYIALDLRNWVDKQYKEKSSSLEEEWEKRLKSVVSRLQKHIDKSPIHVSTEV
ncbi:Bromodomain containing protein [Histomonas meleagridis]|uniref:Bromodomain containing protein n=1 Tax=Histomonas meleagridis TaxID=135588 RepID=UPI0035596E52|nr:Bromodomain containing protein [Histomonas meleagridis]KAH0802652.1 Bromodomain containing protein [Histomonas meleagridis]